MTTLLQLGVSMLLKGTGLLVYSVCSVIKSLLFREGLVQFFVKHPLENYICEMASLLNNFTGEISTTGLKVFQEHANYMLFYLKQINLFLGNVSHGKVLLENCRDF